MLIDEFIQTYDVMERHEITVHDTMCTADMFSGTVSISEYNNQRVQMDIGRPSQ